MTVAQALLALAVVLVVLWILAHHQAAHTNELSGDNRFFYLAGRIKEPN